MFGYITTDPDSLTKEEKERYRAVYCGLCRQLGIQFGFVGQASLTYDLTFVSMLLSSLYDMEETHGSLRCVPHPFTRHPYVITLATEYAANMNVFLAYYKCLDDVNDDRNMIAGKKADLFKKYIPQIKNQYPRQCEMIEHSLERLTALEKTGELNPDAPANCFGELMGELFVMCEDEFAPSLRRMGAALGRFIYLLDACNDLRADIKKQRYNPLVAQLSTDFKPILTLMISECTNEFEKLQPERDLHILRNILYSGVWMKYKTKKKGVENT